jgi:HD superfamily phosphohydrolase YqeK
MCKVTLANVRKVAANYGATVDEQSSGRNGRHFSVTVDLPAGKVWCATQSHTLSDGGFAGSDNSVFCADVIERMEMGTDVCEDEDCEICHP